MQPTDQASLFYMIHFLIGHAFYIPNKENPDKVGCESGNCTCLILIAFEGNGMLFTDM
jgi:hypothetical protein